jgi:hypothetical protein
MSLVGYLSHFMIIRHNIKLSSLKITGIMKIALG